MAALLATGVTATSSADFTISGESTTLFLVSTAGLPSGALAQIEVKGANGVYYPFGHLDPSIPIQVLSGPGTYRVSRPAGADCGVDRV
jgi:hypothetical protein